MEKYICMNMNNMNFKIGNLNKQISPRQQLQETFLFNNFIKYETQSSLLVLAAFPFSGLNYQECTYLHRFHHIS